MTQALYAHMNNKKIKIKKKSITKRAGGVVQGVGPEFKPKYHKKKFVHESLAALLFTEAQN
jgi:hypothetical protein